MKKIALLTQIILIAFSVVTIQSCTKEEDPLEKPNPASEKPVIETLAAENLTENGAVLKANVTNTGSSEIEAIGFVYWDPDMFEIDLNAFFDSTNLLPAEVLAAVVNGSTLLGTFDANIRIDTIDGEIFLGTVGGGLYSPAQVFLGTVGNDVRFPGDTLEELLERIKIINNQRKGEFSAEVKQMMPETRYLVRAYAQSKEGLSYATSVQVITKKPELTVSPGNGVSDWEGRNYPTVIINGTEWMAENLRAKRYNNGTEVEFFSGSGSGSQWLNDTTGSFKYPNNWNDQAEDYGLLYNWYATKNPNQLCPTGWRMPTEQDFTDLIRLLGGPEVAGSAMKTIGNDWWRNNNEDATNESKLSIRGAGGFRGHTSAGAIGFRNDAYFWTSTMYDTDVNGVPIPRFYKLTKDNGTISTNTGGSTNARTGMSVRCIKN